MSVRIKVEVVCDGCRAYFSSDYDTPALARAQAYEEAFWGTPTINPTTDTCGDCESLRRHRGAINMVHNIGRRA